MASSSGLPPTLEETREECFARITGSFSAARPYELKKEKKKETKKRSRHSVDAGDLAEGNKNKTSLAGFHGLLTAQRNSTRDFSFQQSLSLCISSFTFYSIFILSPSTSFNEIMDQRQFLNRVTRSLIV